MSSFLQFILFVAMLLPVTVVSAGGDGISVNYIYAVLIPIIVKFTFRKNLDAYFYVFYLAVSGLIGFFINLFLLGIGADLILRQLISLFIALLPAIFLFVDLNKYYIRFKTAVIFCSALYSIYALLNFLTQSALGIVNPFEIKDVLSEHIPDWPQRYILVLFAGLFFTFDINRRRSIIYICVRMIILFTILITFLRAAYLALLVGFFLFRYSDSYIKKNYSNHLKHIKKERGFGYFSIVIGVIMVGIFFVSSGGLSSILDILYYSFDSIDKLLTGNDGGNTSDETRLSIFRVILNALTISPLTGFGGAGVYIFDPEYGSSHNQYFDFLIRFGVLGLSFFLYFTFRIFRYFWTRESFVIGVIASYLIFGIAHETTKYSYGGVIFFYLLSLTYTKDSTK